MNNQSTSNNIMIPTSISRTALDSLNAKLSAVDCGWLDEKEDDGDHNNDNHNTTTNNNKFGNHHHHHRRRTAVHDHYCKVLRRIQDGLSLPEEDIVPIMTQSQGQGRRRRRRRQTPLVNAGYATRIAVMTCILERWMERIIIIHKARLQTQTKDKCMNIVILGCGLDALGISAKHFLNHHHPHNVLSSEEETINTSLRVKVYEFDAWENCILKRRALIRSGLLTESSTCIQPNGKGEGNDVSTSTPKPSFCSITKGTLIVDYLDGKNHDQKNNDKDDYFLTALDMREFSPSDDIDEDATKRKSILSLAIRDVGLDTSCPTIVLSELVLTYLGYNGANATLRSIAADVLCDNQSLFVCLEPVFHDNSGGDRTGTNRRQHTCFGTISNILSVEESYSREYGYQFLETLQRGNSNYYAPKNKGNVASSSSCMHPLGPNSHCIKKRLQDCGFVPPNIIRYSTLGEAVSEVAHSYRASNATSFLRAKEPFDEHAALALHLSCYGVVCIFSSVSSSYMDDELEDQTIRPRSQNNDDVSTLKMTPISSSLDDLQVRDLYNHVYLHLYQKYPTIKKMVHAAMKTDLYDEKLNSNASTISYRYKCMGGNFWVVKDTTNSMVVGCVGIGLRVSKGGEAFTSTSTVVEYDIHRLALNDRYRGNGIGKKLLSIAEEYARKQEEYKNFIGNPVTVKLFAVTPKCLTNATKLYESAQYNLEGTFQAGSLCMHVYCKRFQVTLAS